MIDYDDIDSEDEDGMSYDEWRDIEDMQESENQNIIEKRRLAYIAKYYSL